MNAYRNIFVKAGRLALALTFFVLLPPGFSARAFAQSLRKIEVSADSFKVTASERLAGRLDTTDLRLVADAIASDSAHHGWIAHFGSIELRFEENYPSFPNIRFFRFFTPNLVTAPGHAVGIDRQKGKAHIIYQSGAADDLDGMAQEQGIKISSDTAALEYFIEALQIRGYFPAVILDTVSELRQYARFQEQVLNLKSSEVPPTRRLYRHLWKDRSFWRFRKGELEELQQKDYERREKTWAGLIRPPAVNLYKDIYNVVLYLARIKELFFVYKVSGFVFQNGAVHYSVVKLNLE